MPKLDVVNVSFEPFEIYCGRACQYHRLNLPASKWANPYKLPPGAEPGATLKLYEAHIRICMIADPKTYNITELRGKKCGCWCKPRGGFQGRTICHVQILNKLLEEYDAKA